MSKSLFAERGVHALVDGQFGSTGKGLFASFLAREAAMHGVQFNGVFSNAGPNSGHTFYHNGEKHVLKQLPTFAVKMALMGLPIPAHLSAGSVIDPVILFREAEKYPEVPIFVHRNAAVIDAAMKNEEARGSIVQVAGTQSGTGAALARRIHREKSAIIGNIEEMFGCPRNVYTYGSDNIFNTDVGRWFLEVSQGFSLGINSQFYPKVTSRECTVMQGIADARIPPCDVARTFMVARTFPIRVGNFEGNSSGGWYFDQMELSWDNFPGIKPELTTVTQRIRRIATFSEAQMVESIMANAPDFILWNFMNYLHLADDVRTKSEVIEAFKGRIASVMSRSRPFEDFYGWGPFDTDITPF